MTLRGHGSLRVRNFEELATPTMADQTDEENHGLRGPKDFATNSGRLKVRNIEDLLTQENGMDLEEGEIYENEYEIVSEDEDFEEVSEREDEKRESVRHTDVGESHITNTQTLEDSSYTILGTRPTPKIRGTPPILGIYP